MTLAVTFLFAAVRRIFADTTAAAAAAAVFLLNPNTLYMGSIPMSEAVFFASLFALLYFTVRFRETRGWGALLGASLAAFCGTLTRYEAWFLLPFVAVYLLISARGKRIAALIIFCLIAALGPALWLAHNRWYYGDPLYFYRGPYSAMALQGTRPYPGQWRLASRGAVFFHGGPGCRGLAGVDRAGCRSGACPRAARGLAGALAGAPAGLLCLGDSFVGRADLRPGVMAAYLLQHPLRAWLFSRSWLLGAAALVRQFPRPIPKPLFAFGIVAIALSPFLIHPTPLQSHGRNRRSTRARAAHGSPRPPHISRKPPARTRPSSPASANSLPIYRTLGIPLRDTLTGDNDLEWNAAMARPDLFLHTDWAVVESGDDMQTMIDRARLHGPRYELQRRVTVKGGPVIEIYKRTYEDPLR